MTPILYHQLKRNEVLEDVNPYLLVALSTVIGGLFTIGVGILTYLGVVKKSDTQEAKMFFEKGVDMRAELHGEARQDIASLENKIRTLEDHFEEELAEQKVIIRKYDQNQRALVSFIKSAVSEEVDDLSEISDLELAHPDIVEEGW